MRGQEALMNKHQMIEHLSALLHLEVHAVEAYDEGLDALRDETQRSRLTAFRADHERHVTDLAELIREMGEEIPQPSPEVEAELADVLAFLARNDDAASALSGLQEVERVTLTASDRAAAWNSFLQPHELIERIRADEREHSAYLDSLMPSPLER